MMTPSTPPAIEQPAPRQHTLHCKAKTVSNAPKQILAFYYPWYGNPATDQGNGWVHWEPNSSGKQATNVAYQPADGLYSSNDPTEVAHQLAEAKAAGITGFISSWWGQGDYTDKNLSVLLSQAEQNGMKITVMLEPGSVSGTGDTLVASIKRDLEYIAKNYTSHSAWLTVNGKPVIFLYADVTKNLTPAQVQSIISYAKTLTPNGVEIMGQYGYPYNANWDGQFDYSHAGDLNGMSLSQANEWLTQRDQTLVPQEKKAGMISTATVMPGFGGATPKSVPSTIYDPRENGQLYATSWQNALASNPDWILISTWNEYHEGSGIEPTTSFKTQYLTETAKYAKQFMGSAYTGTPTGLVQNTTPTSITRSPSGSGTDSSPTATTPSRT